LGGLIWKGSANEPQTGPSLVTISKKWLGFPRPRFSPGGVESTGSGQSQLYNLWGPMKNEDFAPRLKIIKNFKIRMPGFFYYIRRYDRH